ncbi:hypothetical protein BGZ52_000218, partial [Haplosporangium bisporale]
MISIRFSALSPLQLFILFTYTITILCILVIWYIQLRDCRRQYALSFFFLWHFVGSVFGIVNMFLLSEVAFPFSLFNTSSDFSSQSMSASTFTSIHSLTHPDTSSGLTAIIYTKTLTAIVPESDEYTGPVNLCIVFAHLMSVQCLGSCLALTRWTWYIYRSLRRKRGVVNPKLVSVLQVNQPRGMNSDHNNTDPEFTPGFSFSRPFRSLADIQFRLPACVITPIVMTVLLLREIWKQLFFCCYSKHVMPYQHGADLDDNELFENWPKYPSQFDESPRVVGSQSSQRGSDAISVARSASAFSTTPPTTLAAKLGVDQVDLSNPSAEEIAYGYDISGMRIKYTQDSWHHHFKQKVKNHRKMLDEVTVCIFWPLLVMLVLFFIKMPDRSYEVFATRGGCGLPKEGGRADFIMVTTIDAISTAFSATGCLLADFSAHLFFAILHQVLSCRLFQAQNGSVTSKIKSLTPSPAVIQLLKSTALVRNFLNLSLVLNGLIFFSRLVHLISSGIHFRATTPIGFLRPLFNVAEHDYAIFTVFVAMVVALLTLLSLTWTGWSRLAKAVCHFYTKRGAGSEAGDSDDASKFQFQFYETHRMAAAENNEDDDKPARGIRAKTMAALRYARRAHRNTDLLNREERGVRDTGCPELKIEETTEQEEKEVVTSLEAPPKVPSLKVKASRESNGQSMSAPSTHSGSSRYSVSKKRLPSLPKNPASPVLSPRTVDGKALCLRSAYSHGCPEGREAVRSLSPMPHSSRDKPRMSSTDHDKSMAFDECHGRERRRSSGSVALDFSQSSRHISSKTRCERQSDRHNHRHRHHHDRRYRIRHPVHEDVCSLYAHHRQHAYECDRVSTRPYRHKHSSKYARISYIQDEDSSSISEGTSGSEYEDEVSAEEFGVTHGDDRGSKLNTNRRQREVAKRSSISTSELQHEKHLCSRHRHHNSRHHRVSVSASYLSNHSQRTIEDSIAHSKPRTSDDRRYGHPSSSQPKSSGHRFSDEYDHQPVWKGSSRNAYAVSILSCSAMTDKHKHIAPPDSPLLPPDSPLIPPLMSAPDPTSSSQSSLLPTLSSFQIAANEDSDIEHSITLSQRRHMSDPVLPTDLKMKSGGERMMYSSELGRMISLPQGRMPQLRSSSSASIKPHSTMGTFKALRLTKEPIGGDTTGAYSLIASSLNRLSQEHLQHGPVTGSVPLKKVSSKMLSKIYHISKEDAARTVQAIAPAPQIQPPLPPSPVLVKSIAAAHEVVVPVSVSTAILATPLTPPSSPPTHTVQIDSVTQSEDKDDKIKVLFFGSDSFSVPHLEALIQEK